MSLCIVGKEPLDVLQASTEDWHLGLAYFGSIPQRRLADRPWKSLDPYPPRLSRGTPLIVEAVPVSEARSVSLTWTITFPDRKAREETIWLYERVSRGQAGRLHQPDPWPRGSWLASESLEEKGLGQ
eukprot:s981_g15.t1